MKIPSCFYGTRSEAKRECDKVARKVWKGVPLLEAECRDLFEGGLLPVTRGVTGSLKIMFQCRVIILLVGFSETTNSCTKALKYGHIFNGY